MLIAGIDTSSSTLATVLTLIAKEQVRKDGKLVTQADCPFTIDTKLWLELQQEQDRVQSGFEAGHTAEGRVVYKEGFSAQDSLP